MGWRWIRTQPPSLGKGNIFLGEKGETEVGIKYHLLLGLLPWLLDQQGILLRLGQAEGSENRVQRPLAGEWAFLAREPPDHPPRMLSDVLEEQWAGRSLIYCVTRDEPVPFPQRYSLEIQGANTCNSYQLLTIYYSSSSQQPRHNPNPYLQMS